jgi:DtxR family transcriptional regulator, Mn-dependent transcriptional regulator
MAMITSTVENYVKQIYLQQQEDPTSLLPMGKLASAMKVVPGTATAMVKTLSDSGLVDYEPRGGIRLTHGGEQLALHVLRRHRILELFLVDVLGLDWSEVHEEAETLEHAVSDKVLERMDKLLNHPQVDPHGDPIPTAKGHIRKVRLIPLSEFAPDTAAEIARVADQDPAFLQFAEKNGLIPGVGLSLLGRDVHADSVTVRLENDVTVTLGGKAAEKILVRAATE